MKINLNKKIAKEEMYQALTKALNLNILNKPIAIVCIGSDRATGDSLGPLTGSFLEHKKYKVVKILGTLDCPIHAKNLNTLDLEKYFVIAIDAGLTKKETDIGMLEISYGSFKPGAGVGKDLKTIGDVNIIGYVNFSSNVISNNYIILQNTRLNNVMKLSKFLAKNLDNALKTYERSIYNTDDREFQNEKQLFA